jgi:hypothetical protein
LLVCNHLSYLDILVLGSLAPMAFVSSMKFETGRCSAGSLAWQNYIRPSRAKEATLRVSSAEIRQAWMTALLSLCSRAQVQMEGRCSRSSQPCSNRQPDKTFLAASFIRYTLTDGSVPDEVCYWRDAALIPHLLICLVNAAFRRRSCSHRCNTRLRPEELARQLHAKSCG